MVVLKSKQYIDKETGEEVTFDVIDKFTTGKQFWKLYLQDFLAILGIVENRQLDVLVYILENTCQANNIFIGTYSKIETDVKVSRQTIAKIMKKLQNNEFITKVTNGVWMVNPKFLFKGDENKKQMLIRYFKEGMNS